LKNKNAIPNSLFLQVAAKLHQRQSDQLWERNKNAQQQFGYPWHWAFDKASASRQSSALDALVAAVASSNLNLGLGATATGSAPCTPEARLKTPSTAPRAGAANGARVARVGSRSPPIWEPSV
jgi:hypothetical protein